MRVRRVAILIDGSFLLKRLPKIVSPHQCDTPERVAVLIRRLCRGHMKLLTGRDDQRWLDEVHRIFYYDAIPYDGKAHHPLDERPIDFSRTDVAIARHALFDLLRKQRKLALRLGKVTRERDWAISPSLTKKLLRTRRWMAALDRLGEADEAEPARLELMPAERRSLIELRDLWRSIDGGAVTLGLKQKGVDMRIGLDISTLTLKKQADTIVLVAGDSDFVPAAKLARREGVEFVLDPLWQKINADLFEHIDGLQSGLPRPGGAGAADGSKREG
jgi:uncharacterized LabA/DUF88 family protein